MTLPASITANLFPDFKNSFIGPFARIEQETQDTDNSTSETIGTNTTNIEKAQSFQVSTSGEITSVDLRLSKTASPTDNVLVELCADNAGDPGTVLATGTVIPAASLSGTAKYFKSTFFFPPTLQTSTTYWIVASRSGSLDATNFVQWMKNSTAPYANGQLKLLGSGGVWTGGTGDARFKCNIRTSGRYQPCVDKTNNKIRMFKSTDGGNTWSEQDSADAPALSTSANFKSFSAVQVDMFINVCRITDGNGGFAVWRYDTGSDQWEAALHTNSTSMPVNTSVAGVAPMLVGYKSVEATWDYAIACNGQTETVMGNARRRIKLKRRSGGGYPSSPGYDIVGSPNTPDLTTLPSTAVDYDLRAALVDGNGTWHGFWTQTDDSNIHHRQYNEGNTFSTANLMGSTAAVTSNSAAYSVGLPVNYYRSGEWYIAIPYVDSGVLKVSRVKAADAATAANWTNTSVITATIETTNSNPAVLVADNEQGGKLFLIYTKTDGKLYYTHDQANDSWVAEQELHPSTKTVGVISGGVMVDAIGLSYLDTAPATDDLKFDSL